MPVALAKFRLIEPLTGGGPSSGWNRYHHGSTGALRGLAREADWLGAGHDLPIGQSLLLIGEKQR